MWRFKTLVLTGLAWISAMGPAAASSPLGVTSAVEPAYIAAVEVVQDDKTAPEGFADGLRVAVVSEAGLYGTSGLPLTLKIELDRVHLKNPVQAMLIGDNNMTRGRVVVVDPATGRELGAFLVRVDAERHGLNGGAIAMALIGALDPTGYVDVGTTVAGAASSRINHSHTETMMIANFAVETLRQTFGDARARVVHGRKPKA
jgi:hypothetical protein